jgi:hypothetical protein
VEGELISAMNARQDIVPRGIFPSFIRIRKRSKPNLFSEYPRAAV